MQLPIWQVQYKWLPIMSPSLPPALLLTRHQHCDGCFGASVVQNYEFSSTVGELWAVACQVGTARGLPCSGFSVGWCHGLVLEYWDGTLVVH
jgi:hypothetical protein